jgi:hypothetical protein
MPRRPANGVEMPFQGGLVLVRIRPVALLPALLAASLLAACGAARHPPASSPAAPAFPAVPQKVSRSGLAPTIAAAFPGYDTSFVEAGVRLDGRTYRVVAGVAPQPVDAPEAHPFQVSAFEWRGGAWSSIYTFSTGSLGATGLLDSLDPGAAASSDGSRDMLVWEPVPGTAVFVSGALGQCGSALCTNGYSVDVLDGAGGRMRHAFTLLHQNGQPPFLSGFHLHGAAGPRRIFIPGQGSVDILSWSAASGSLARLHVTAPLSTEYTLGAEGVPDVVYVTPGYVSGRFRLSLSQMRGPFRNPGRTGFTYRVNVPAGATIAVLGDDRTEVCAGNGIVGRFLSAQAAGALANFYCPMSSLILDDVVSRLPPGLTRILVAHVSLPSGNLEAAAVLDVQAG